MLSEPRKENNTFYCNINSQDNFRGLCDALTKTGNKVYSADFEESNQQPPTEHFEDMILQELKTKGKQWFDISEQMIEKFFLYSGHNIILHYDEDFEITDNDYIIHYTPYRLIIESNNFHLEYKCYLIEKHNYEEIEEEEQEQEKEQEEGEKEHKMINLVRNLSINQKREDNKNIQIKQVQTPIQEKGEEQEKEEEVNPISSTSSNHDFLRIIKNQEEYEIEDYIDLNDKNMKSIENKNVERQALLKRINELRIQGTLFHMEANKLEQKLINF